MINNLSSLEESLNYIFNNKGLLQTALIHSSYSHEVGIKENNERLEFLGDSVIHLHLAEFIYSKYNDDEGTLSALRSFCESEPFLSKIARDISLGKYIMLGKGEQITGGANKDSILANTFEAIVGGIHLDGGYKKSRKFLIDIFSLHMDYIYNEKLFLDSKSLLQIYTQKYFNKAIPSYVLIKEEGEEHDKLFTIEVFCDEYSAIGKGSNKKSAEKDAANKLLFILKRNA